MIEFSQPWLVYLWNVLLLLGVLVVAFWFHHLSKRDSDYIYEDSYRGRYSNAPDEYEDTFIEDEEDEDA